MDQVYPSAAGESSLDRETYTAIEILGRSIQDCPSGGNGSGGWIHWIQMTGY